ncbi:MAG: hypothetical protein J6Y02_12530 [Pseudobutyrivibrio sp.]|nr:hypothetical protein [Pseudobutyrivibrio sp.]
MTVKDLIDLQYDIPFVINGIEYKDPKNDIPWTMLLCPVIDFDAREDDGVYKVFISINL